MADRVKTNPRQLAAQARYRANNRERLRAKAREARNDPVKLEKKRASSRATARRYYEKNKERCKRDSGRVRRAKQGEIKRYLDGYLSSHPCVDCGENDPVVLEFDHRDPMAKAFNIGAFRRDGKNLPEVIQEIKKCDVRCANCHRRKTFSEGAWLTRRAKTVTSVSLPQLSLFDLLT